jgi:hypothetical protein
MMQYRLSRNSKRARVGRSELICPAVSPFGGLKAGLSFLNPANQVFSVTPRRTLRRLNTSVRWLDRHPFKRFGKSSSVADMPFASSAICCSLNPSDSPLSMAGVPQAKGLNIKYRELSPGVVQASHSLEHLEEAQFFFFVLADCSRPPDLPLKP